MATTRPVRVNHDIDAAPSQRVIDFAAALDAAAPVEAEVMLRREEQSAEFERVLLAKLASLSAPHDQLEVAGVVPGHKIDLETGRWDSTSEDAAGITADVQEVGGSSLDAQVALDWK